MLDEAVTVIADRRSVVAVKIEAPNVTALDEATGVLAGRLEAAVPRRLSGLRVIAKTIERK